MQDCDAPGSRNGELEHAVPEQRARALHEVVQRAVLHVLRYKAEVWLRAHAVQKYYAGSVSEFGERGFFVSFSP